MNFIKKLQYKYLQSSYKPRRNRIISKDSFKAVDEMEKYLDKKISKLMGKKEEDKEKNTDGA